MGLLRQCTNCLFEGTLKVCNLLLGVINAPFGANTLTLVPLESRISRGQLLVEIVNLSFNFSLKLITLSNKLAKFALEII